MKKSDPPETGNPVSNILVFDYDGTLTVEERTIPDSTIEALREVKQRGLAILGIVSGRDLEFLMEVNEHLSELFSFLVAENGAVYYFRDTGEESVKGIEWSRRAREVFAHLSFPHRFSQVMLSVRREHTPEITELLRDSELDAKLVPNRESLMVLPPNIDKGTGVAAAVQHYGETKDIMLTCFGDGENDEALFGPADIGVAVSNAVESLKKIADVVTTQPGGYGVEEYLRETLLAPLGS